MLFLFSKIPKKEELGMNIELLNIWTRYFLVWPGLSKNPPQDRISKKPDVLLAQAFGRNTLGDADLWWLGNLAKKESGAVADEVRDMKFDPGQPNRELAVLLTNILIANPRLAAIIQWEIAMALDKEWYERNQDRIIWLWPPDGAKRFSTRDVLLDSFKIMKEKGWKRPIVLAHKRQIVRAYLIARRLAWKTSQIETAFAYPSEVSSFDKGSKQWQTASSTNWVIYEALCRAIHLLRRWV